MNTSFKAIVLTAVTVLAVFTGLMYTSCKPDKCKAITCAYGGVCSGGECTCATGYEGTQCEKITRDKFLGTWTVTEKGTLSNPAIYTIAISAAEPVDEVTIKNFYNLFPGNVLVAARVSDDTLYIQRQERFNRTVEGRGYLTPNAEGEENAALVMHYYVVDSLGRRNDFGWDLGQPSLWDKHK
jgi:hypothetical protein